MHIEKRHIVINPDNIQDYRERGFLDGGAYDTSWDFVNNKQVGVGTVIVYNYSFAPELGILPNDYLYQCATKINSEQNRIIAHERHHGHNAEIGLTFHLAQGFCFVNTALDCLDEISARIAEKLYDISETPFQRCKTRVLGAFGQKPLNRAFDDALNRFSGQVNDYCLSSAKKYARAIITGGFNSGYAETLLRSQQQVYKFDLEKIRSVIYGENFHRAVSHYLTFDNGLTVKNLGSQSKEKLRNFWQSVEPIFLQYSKYCVAELLEHRR